MTPVRVCSSPWWRHYRKTPHYWHLLGKSARHRSINLTKCSYWWDLLFSLLKTLDGLSCSCERRCLGVFSGISLYNGQTIWYCVQLDNFVNSKHDLCSAIWAEHRSCFWTHKKTSAMNYGVYVMKKDDRVITQLYNFVKWCVFTQQCWENVYWRTMCVVSWRKYFQVVIFE